MIWELLLITDFGNHRVRKVSIVDDRVTTYAGDGNERFMDGDGDHASFRHPSALALNHKNGELYVADFDNERIRLIDINRMCSRYIPSYVMRYCDNPIRAVSIGPIGRVRTVAGCGMANYQDGGGSTGTDVGFNNIRGIALDERV
jgi:hypothetical protein